ncbi:hypothetical protein CDS [Bradyrhizobium sp.]|nr:hypothetical protein CDS [Bradyrhizobium sp.]
MRGACGGSRGHGIVPRGAIGSAPNIGTDGAQCTVPQRTSAGS